MSPPRELSLLELDFLHGWWWVVLEALGRLANLLAISALPCFSRHQCAFLVSLLRLRGSSDGVVGTEDYYIYYRLFKVIGIDVSLVK